METRGHWSRKKAETTSTRDLIPMEYRMLPAFSQEFPCSAIMDSRRLLYHLQRKWREYAFKTPQKLLRQDAPRQEYAPSEDLFVIDTPH